jgi:uncharacterized repeat protein (TIGR04138 family)
MTLDWKSAYAAMYRDGEAAFPPAALHYVLQRVRRAARERAGGTSTPEEIVAAFRAGARADFGPLVRDVLGAWKIEVPEDLGRAVLLLGRYRCLSLEPSDTLEAFAADDRPLHGEIA